MSEYSATFPTASMAKLWVDHQDEPLEIMKVNCVEILSGGTLVLYRRRVDNEFTDYEKWTSDAYNFFAPNGWVRFQMLKDTPNESN